MARGGGEFFAWSTTPRWQCGLWGGLSNRTVLPMGQQCCISAVPSLTPRHLKQVFQQTRGAQNFSKSFKKHHIYYWVFRLIFHSWFIWCPISRAFERTTHMTISSTLKFTNTLPYAWKYHIGLIAQNLSKKGDFLSSITFPWLLMIFQSSMTFRDFSKNNYFPSFSGPCGNPAGSQHWCW